MTELRAGQFVKSLENNLGIGKVASIDDRHVTIEYFESPTSEDHPTRTLPVDLVQPTELHQETRVYFKHPATGHWYVGRALIKTGDEYRVQFPNRKVGELPESSLYVRWDRPIEDPTDHLAHRVNETPYFHDGRAPFRKSLVEQRAACAGMTGLFSSVIELEEHQIEVIRRVLEDPVQRYMLADEVGLGKTIEAGAIMRQYALDRPHDFGILVTVPRHLCEQWEEELANRFLFDQELGERVHVIPHDECEEVLATGMEVGMVVVDEAHQVAQHAHADDPEERSVYDTIKSVTDVTDKLLLLSGTPVLHNEAGYLAMLHLLDPLLYPLDDIEGFRQRIRDRQKVAELFHDIDVDADDADLEEAVDAVADHFPDDERLEELAGELGDVLDDGDEQTRQTLVGRIRTHVSETYRLHRRILRTRHSEETRWLLPGRAEPKPIDVEASEQATIEERLEHWRKAAVEHLDGPDDEAANFWIELYREMFEAACGLTSSLEEFANDRLEAIDDGSATPPEFDDEVELLEDLTDAIADSGRAEHQLDRLVDYLGELDDDQKAVVFVGAEDDADGAHDRLDEQLDLGVVRHEAVRHHHEADWKRFLEQPDCQVLVCDHRAEEGLNLQGSQAEIIHLDLPVSPNRIEQRIGRLDRYGTGQPVESSYFSVSESEYLSRLVELHRDGFGVFTRSIASLQYLVEQRLNELWPRIFFDGLDEMTEATEQLGGDDGGVARELERIRAQDELDALEASQKSDDEFYDRLWDVDFAAEHLEEVAYEWIRKRLQFHRVDTEHDHEGIHRWEYRTERTAKHPTLMPIRELLGRFSIAVDPTVDGFLSYPMSFHRGTACSHGVRVARIGEPFITAMMDYIRWDDRGTSFAMWRHAPRARLEDDPRVYFRFDFLVEADIQNAVDALSGYEHVTEEAVRLRADGLFPPLMNTVWVRADGARVDDEDIQELLDLPYDQEGVKRYGRDYNLNSERWEKIEKMYDRESWTSTCHEVREEAEDVLAEEVSLKERCKRYADRAVRRSRESLDRLETRADRAGEEARQLEIEQLELERQLISTLEEGIRTPSVKLDAIGAIFLSTVDPFEAEEQRR